jgi:selenocysteine lyase/cysteine desulfurase
MAGVPANRISDCAMSDEHPALRACITSYRTTQADIDRLVEALEDARVCRPTA